MIVHIDISSTANSQYSAYCLLNSVLSSLNLPKHAKSSLMLNEQSLTLGLHQFFIFNTLSLLILFQSYISTLQAKRIVFAISFVRNILVRVQSKIQSGYNFFSDFLCTMLVLGFSFYNAEIIMNKHTYWFKNKLMDLWTSSQCFPIQTNKSKTILIRFKFRSCHLISSLDIPWIQGIYMFRKMYLSKVNCLGNSILCAFRLALKTYVLNLTKIATDKSSI